MFLRKIIYNWVFNTECFSAQNVCFSLYSWQGRSTSLKHEKIFNNSSPAYTFLEVLLRSSNSFFFFSSSFSSSIAIFSLSWTVTLSLLSHAEWNGIKGIQFRLLGFTIRLHLTWWKKRKKGPNKLQWLENSLSDKNWF